jgi:hypothetical protein
MYAEDRKIMYSFTHFNIKKANDQILLNLYVNIIIIVDEYLIVLVV